MIRLSRRTACSVSPARLRCNSPSLVTAGIAGFWSVCPGRVGWNEGLLRSSRVGRDSHFARYLAASLAVTPRRPSLWGGARLPHLRRLAALCLFGLVGSGAD